MTSNKTELTYILQTTPQKRSFSLKDFIETDVFKENFCLPKKQVKMEYVYETIPQEEIVKNEEYYQKMYDADVEV